MSFGSEKKEIHMYRFFQEELLKVINVTNEMYIHSHRVFCVCFLFRLNTRKNIRLIELKIYVT